MRDDDGHARCSSRDAACGAESEGEGNTFGCGEVSEERALSEGVRLADEERRDEGKGISDCLERRL